MRETERERAFILVPTLFGCALKTETVVDVKQGHDLLGTQGIMLIRFLFSFFILQNFVHHRIMS
jgi:hypothetical protein